MTEYPTCSTCRFLDVDKSSPICRRMPPINTYGEWPPIGYPDKQWCGEHQFKAGPARQVDVDPPTFVVQPPAPLDDPQPEVLPLTSPPRKRNR